QADPLDSRRCGDRPHMHRQGLGRRALAERRHRRRSARHWLVGVRALAPRALAAVTELPMVSRARQGGVMIRVPLLIVAIVAAIAVGAITGIVVMHPYLSLDATVERDIQATNLGPLPLTFPFFTWLGGPGGVPMQIVVI